MKKWNRTLTTLILAVLFASVAVAAAGQEGVVNINTASTEQLAYLPRVGPALAGRIVEFRDSNGKFKATDELMLVRGIGEGTYELLKPYVTIDGKTTLTEPVSPGYIRKGLLGYGEVERPRVPARDVVAAAARRLRPFVPPPFLICRKQTPECGLHSGRDDRRAVAILGLLATIGLPALFRTAARLRLEMAGREVASVLRLAQAYAVRHSANVAVRFETTEDGRVRFRLHRDGDGDGVLNRDIDAGIDPAITPSRVVRYLGANVGFSFPQREPPLHPSTGRPLQNLGDPIRFNRSDLASFAPLGTATPGTLYLSDRRSQLVAVRVVSRTGRVRIQRYDYETRRWTEI